MTDQELIDYYKALLIMQYIDKPKASAHIDALVAMAIVGQLPLEVQNAFDIDTAVGVQLDVLAKYIGVSRTGFGFTTFITLSDADFRILMKVKIALNSQFSSTENIMALIQEFFADQIFFTDHQTMRISYMIDSSAPGPASSEVVQLMVTQNLLPKPMAVGRGTIIINPGVSEFFGFRTYFAAGVNNNPFNDYDDYQTDWPWLSYQMGLGV